VSKDISDKELMRLYRARMKDKSQSRSRRKKRLEEAPMPFSDLLVSFFKGDGEAMRRIQESRAVLAWPEYVGEVASRYSEALRFRNGTLLVYVPDPLWMQQLSLLKHELMKKYRHAFPALGMKDIFFTRQRNLKYEPK
jgi:hypothetical protein